MDPNSAADRLLKTLAQPLAEELSRILSEARATFEAEAQQRIQKAVTAAEAALKASAAQQLEKAVAEAEESVRSQVTLEMKTLADREIQSVRAQSEEEKRLSSERWTAEKSRLAFEVERWKQFADFHNQIHEVSSQAEALTRFLRAAEAFAPSIAVYVTRPEGLGLWRSRGDAVEFPPTVTSESVDPEHYFAAIAIRSRPVGAVVAAQGFDRAALDRLVAALNRGIEGMASQMKAARAAATPKTNGGDTRVPEAPLTEEDERQHAEARKHARLLISEIKLYHEQQLKEGRANSDIYDRLRADIDKGRESYRQRVPQSVSVRRDYYHEELVRILAESDAGRLGSAYPGPMSS